MLKFKMILDSASAALASEECEVLKYYYLDALTIDQCVEKFVLNHHASHYDEEIFHIFLESAKKKLL